MGRCERAQEGTGGAMGGGDALTHPTPHTLPTEATGRATGHAGRQIVRRGGAGRCKPSEPRRGRTDAPQSAKRGEGHSYPPTAPREPQPPRMTRRGCATHLYEYGSTAQPQSRKPARRKG